MIRMNRSMNLPAMQRVMMEFERQKWVFLWLFSLGSSELIWCSEIMEMKQEMIEETMDDTFEMEGDEEAESENILNQVLDEIGMSLSDQLTSAPQNETQAQVTMHASIGCE